MAILRNIGSVHSKGDEAAALLLQGSSGLQGGDFASSPMVSIPQVQKTITRKSIPNIATIGGIDDSDILGIPVKHILLAGAGIGTIYLLNKRSTMGKTNLKKVLPLLAVGGLAVWYFFLRDKDSGGGARAVDAAELAGLTVYYTGRPKEQAALKAADGDTLHKWYMITQIWANNANPYAFLPDGVTPTASVEQSIGKWWEFFSESNQF